MNAASQVAARVVDIVRSAWNARGWTSGGGGSGSEGAHRASYTCLLASGYKAAYEELAHIREAKDDGKDFYGELNQQDPVMDLVERAMAQAIKELYPEFYSPTLDRCDVVMRFNDNPRVGKSMAVAVAERAREIIEQQERLAEWVRCKNKDVTLPASFSFFSQPEDKLADEVDEILAESEEALRQAQEATGTTEEAVKEEEAKKPARKVLMN